MIKSYIKHKSYRKLLLNQNGFTLTELMIAATLSLVLLSAIATIFISQHNAYEIQDQVAEMQQNARVAINEITTNIRMAGYDPLVTDLFGFTDSAFTTTIATANAIYFTTDYDEDGAVAATTNERKGYKLDSGDLKVGSSISGGVINSWRSLAENISDLNFTYTFEDGGTGLADNTDGDSTNDFEDIRVVEVTVTAITSREDGGYTHPTEGDGYRRRTLKAKIRPMNLGL